LRLPRLYRLARLMRLVKVLKLLRYNAHVVAFMDAIGLSDQTSKMFKLALTVAFITHIASCLWFFFAKIELFADYTWVARNGLAENGVLLEDSLFFLYSTSQYWAL
jgi:hypothetical protein